MKSYRKSQFDNLEKKNPNKSLFDLSHEIKTQMCFGRYYPIHFEECLPGDEWTLDGEYQFRFPSLYFPIQQIGTMRCDIFYCPMKLMFNGLAESQNEPNKFGWMGFIMGEDIELPYTRLNINGDGFGGSSGPQLYPGCSYPIENYLGFPMDTTGRLDEDKQMNIAGSAFQLNMYLFCYDNYYRNPLWEDEQWFNLNEGDNSATFEDVKQIVDGITQLSWANTGVGGVITNHPPFFAHYEKDYFTSARPEPQDGDPIKIPLLNDDATSGPSQWLKDPSPWTPPSDQVPADPGALSTDASGRTIDSSTDEVYLDIASTAANIKSLRLAQVLQQFHERVMRIGKRYRGYIEGLWGNDPEPNAIDIPQLVGSHFGRIQITDSITTADTSEAKTGNYRGNINFHNNGTQHHYYCQDYGMLMWIINLMPNTAYGQGAHPAWFREVNTDYALDMFAGIGDQEIKRKELLILNVESIWADATEPYNATIGYQDRFAEWKTRVNRMFNTQELYDSFYMGQKLGGVEEDYDEITAGRLLVGSSYPTSNGIREADIFNTLPIKSGASLYTDATIYAHMYLTIKVKRALPYFSTPGKMIF